jgi:hypothetical protein
MARKTWGERYREAFIVNANKRLFTDVEFRKDGDKLVVYCNDGRGKGIVPMDAKTEILISRYVIKQLEKE